MITSTTETEQNEMPIKVKIEGAPIVKRRTDDGKLAECPMCESLDIGCAHDTVNCYGCGLSITKKPPLQNAVNAWNMRGGKAL